MNWLRDRDTNVTIRVIFISSLIFLLLYIILYYNHEYNMKIKEVNRYTYIIELAGEKKEIIKTIDKVEYE